MVGPWPLAPHHDHLQYIHHIHLMQQGQNQGVTLHQKLKMLRIEFCVDRKMRPSMESHPSILLLMDGRERPKM